MANTATTIVAITAHYARDADAIFAEAISLDRLHHDMRGLIDYHGMPRGDLHEGQSYGFTPVLWTWIRLPEARMICTRVDPVARVVQQRETSAEGTTYTTTITPDGAGCLWTDRIELHGPTPNGFVRWLTRHIHRAAHRRRRARDITISFRDT